MRNRRPTTAKRWRTLGVGLLLLPAWLSCQPAEPPAMLPVGPLVAGDAEAFRQILQSLEQLESTPLAREARRASLALRSCEAFLTTGEGGTRLFEGSACVEESALSPALDELREDAAIIFIWPLGGAASEQSASSSRRSGPSLVGRIHVSEDGSLRLEARLDRLPTTGWSRWLLPHDQPAGAARLATRDALVQGRFRPRSGLELASLVDTGSQADLMFKLKSELFAGAALGDAWEFAIYMPRPGATIPPIAVSLDVENPSLAEAGVRRFVAELEAAWPLQARAARFGAASGACFDELRIMPEFAPCYALGEASLVFGWNPQSIEVALSGAGTTNSALPGRLVADLSRFAEADQRLELAAKQSPDERRSAAIAPASLPPVSAAPPSARRHGPYPFDRFELELRPAGDSLDLVARLSRQAVP